MQVNTIDNSYGETILEYAKTHYTTKIEIWYLDSEVTKVPWRGSIKYQPEKFEVGEVWDELSQPGYTVAAATLSDMLRKLDQWIADKYSEKLGI